MAVKVMMPKGSDTMTEGKVLKWLKKEGDTISTGDSLVEIETDKVNMEVEAMGSGVLRKILVAADKVVPVGELLAVIAKADEDISALVKSNGAPRAEARTQEPGGNSNAPATAARGNLRGPPTPRPRPPATRSWSSAPVPRSAADPSGSPAANP